MRAGDKPASPESDEEGESQSLVQLDLHEAGTSEEGAQHGASCRFEEAQRSQSNDGRRASSGIAIGRTSPSPVYVVRSL